MLPRQRPNSFWIDPAKTPPKRTANAVRFYFGLRFNYERNFVNVGELIAEGFYVYGLTPRSRHRS
jgi:hypothetical protein